MKLKKILIMAGGTGGHVFPGLAVAKKMRESGVEVHWLGTEKGLEVKIIPREGFPLHFVTVGALNSVGWMTKIMTLAALPFAILQSVILILKLNKF